MVDQTTVTNLRAPAAENQVIDREKILRFTFDGKEYTAYKGDTIASALAAGGVKIFSRSFKYHRPRGLLCVAGNCPNCLVTVDGTPNVQSCRTPVQNGMQVNSQNSSPDVFCRWGSITRHSCDPGSSGRCMRKYCARPPD
jgi:sarcosine oxidase subunit alpha